MTDPYRVTMRARIYPLDYEEPKPPRCLSQLSLMILTSQDVIIKHEIEKLLDQRD